MSKRFITGSDFIEMVLSGANILQSRVADVNALNVFPVPDGDTGTNMNLTLTSGVEQLKNNAHSHIGKTAEVLSKGLLMGARGNSGVILSQLFRGFAKSVQQLKEVNTVQFAAALQQGVDMAYQAVVKPVEGTILTVSREAAKHAVLYARRTTDVLELMKEVVSRAQDALSRTPEMLPVLKQVGVVDSGGQGLVFIYEGFLAALSGPDSLPAAISAYAADVNASAAVALRGRSAAAKKVPNGSAQSQIATEEIEFLYDMEFFILCSKRHSFDADYFRQLLEKDGDSILVIAEDDMVKVHVHSKNPGDVLTLALRYGEISRIHIQNMRDQHRDLLRGEVEGNAEFPAKGSANNVFSKPYGMISVSAGEGIADIFTSLGVDYVLSGGQTMNPSTEDIVNAIHKVDAEKVFIFPNNSNIILAAQQAKDLVDKEIAVIPTRTIPQGMAAALAFQANAGLEQNAEMMNQAIKDVRSGQITYAVRDSVIDGMNIKRNDYLGMLDNKIITTAPDLLEACKQLLETMIADKDEILTVLTGAEVMEQQIDELTAFIEVRFPDVETEIHAGGQPLYYFIFSVE